VDKNLNKLRFFNIKTVVYLKVIHKLSTKCE